RLADRDALEGLFEAQLALRGRIARHADCPDYRAYAFKLYQRFDYGPAECEAFHRAVETSVVPLLRRLQAERRRAMGLAALRPWDLAVDPAGRPPLKPFATAGELEERAARLFRRLDPALGARFDRMRELGLLSLENYKGKAPGGYQETYAERRLPFIFMNAVGTDQDVQTLVHEGGHAFHAFAARDHAVRAYRSTGAEFAEVASMGMELLALPYLDEFYPDPEVRSRAVRARLETIVEILPWIAAVDAFQHWIYTHPGHDREERRGAWVALLERFGGDVDWSGFEPERASLWHRQLHLFVCPFYYIEYGIAQLGALGLWRAARRDPAAALAAYRRALALGGSRPLPELFAAAGLPFDLSERTVAPLAEELTRSLFG
ncbi:MAG: M3 family metallopeptidase, partial [bacterium]